ncbi:Os01g0668650 [Oryza sativa Japonica Group]|uniref:Os01g0668650 protein n=1 Tax=Oryza sativa subsp. japonica TaxID=39947 RepID=A0A0P0V699_ORYSJ|nr:Os01g0668650 [Oryza sativa Japonica Group]
MAYTNATAREIPSSIHPFQATTSNSGSTCKEYCSVSNLRKICSLADETTSYLFLHCPFASGLWASLHIDPGIDDVKQLHALQPPSVIPTAHFRPFFLLCLWGLWNHRAMMPSSETRSLVIVASSNDVSKTQLSGHTG